MGKTDPQALVMAMDHLSQTIKSYDSGARWHSEKFDAYDWPLYLSKFVKMLEGKKVLDLGCGNGSDCEFFAKHGLDATGIYYSAELLKLAKSRVTKAKFFKANFLKPLEFKDNEFGGVWACASLLHVPKKKYSRGFGRDKKGSRARRRAFCFSKRREWGEF